MKSFAGFLLQN